MKINIHTVSFVRFSDLVSGLSDDTKNAISAHIGHSVTWGDSLHTLIAPKAVIANLGIEDIDESYDEFVVFRKRLTELPKFVLIDMEQ